MDGRVVPLASSGGSGKAKTTVESPGFERLSITEARRNLPSLIRAAEHGKAVQPTRRGEPVAVLIGHRMFCRLAAGRRDFADAYREFKRRVGPADLGLDPDALNEGVWDPTPGRHVRL